MASTMRFDRWEDSLGNLVAESSTARGIVATTSGGTNSKSYMYLASDYTTSTTAVTDMPGLSMTFNAVTGRLYKISFSTYCDTSVANCRVDFRFTNSSNVSYPGSILQDAGYGAWTRGTFNKVFYITGSGSTTIKVRFSAVDSASYYFYGINGTYPAQATSLFIEDIGPA